MLTFLDPQGKPRRKRIVPLELTRGFSKVSTNVVYQVFRVKARFFLLPRAALTVRNAGKQMPLGYPVCRPRSTFFRALMTLFFSSSLPHSLFFPGIVYFRGEFGHWQRASYPCNLLMLQIHVYSLPPSPTFHSLFFFFLIFAIDRKYV